MSIPLDHKPICRCCGKPIPKATKNRYVRKRGNWQGSTEDLVLDEYVFTKEQLQPYTNHAIIAVRYWGGDGPEAKAIHQFYTWDGESYIDEFFCSGQCAKDFGYMCARRGRATIRATEAMKKAGQNTLDIYPLGPV